MEFFHGEYLACIDFMSKITQYLAMWMHTCHAKIANLLHVVSVLTCITLIYAIHRMIPCPNFGHMKKYDYDCHTNDLDLTITRKHD